MTDYPDKAAFDHYIEGRLAMTKQRCGRSPSIPDLYDRMVANGSKIAAASEEPEDGPTVPMSVRVSPHIKAYYEAQAKACGMPSASAMVAMVLRGVMVSTKEQTDG